jgi:hypothetical protein
MSSHLGEYKAQNKDNQEIRMEKVLLTASGREKMGIASKTIKFPNKGHMRILFGGPKFIHVECNLWAETILSMFHEGAQF